MKLFLYTNMLKGIVISVASLASWCIEIFGDHNRHLKRRIFTLSYEEKK